MKHMNNFKFENKKVYLSGSNGDKPLHEFIVGEQYHITDKKGQFEFYGTYKGFVIEHDNVYCVAFKDVDGGETHYLDTDCISAEYYEIEAL